MHDYQQKILIVDDQCFNIDAAIIVLKYSIKLCRSSDIIDSASDGVLALEKVKKNVILNNYQKCTYDLILMDCNMPFMDGYESTDMIRSYLYDHFIDQPIILAVTGHTETQYVEKAINCGMNQVLSKPIQSDILK